jgi:hypothetical protein
VGSLDWNNEKIIAAIEALLNEQGAPAREAAGANF